MSLKIITGDYRGRTLETPDVTDPTSPIRPTKGMVREAMFNILFARVDFENLNILDLFSGSGQAGIECLSRGAEHVTFVDTQPECTQKNLRALEVDALRYSVMSNNVLAVKTNKVADVIFADPPYGKSLINDILKRKDDFGTTETLWMLEFERGFTPEVNDEHFDVIKLKRFGKSMIMLLEQK